VACNSRLVGRRALTVEPVPVGRGASAVGRRASTVGLGMGPSGGAVGLCAQPLVGLPAGGQWLQVRGHAPVCRRWPRYRASGCGYGRGMRVHVDPERCQGHNRCYAIAPELFDIDDLGNAHEVGDGTVAPGLEEKAQLAVANCPEFAISVA
jgi:ferredoxin